MSEPGAPPPYQPYGTGPYGASPYGASPYGGAPARTPTDAVSIVGFVLSLLCCTSIVGLILGIVGLRRTKNGERGGRWAAISAVAIGIVGTIAFVTTVVFVTWFGTNTVSLGNAEVGQCVDVDEFSDGNDATLWEKDCDEPHEAEIAVADEFDRDLLASYDEEGGEAFCTLLLADEYAEAVKTGVYEVGVVFEAIEPETGDDFICYLERADGDELGAPIG